MIGSEILRDVDFLGEGKLVVRHHHERWDGHGYPDGLAGDAIPLAARVFAVADALDALTTDRPYRPAPGSTRPAPRSCAGAGTQFDPESSAPIDAIPDAHLRRSARRRAVTRTILIVDDDPLIRKLIATTLEDVSGYRLRRRATARRRSSARPRARPQIVFLDVDMPRLNGIEACRRLRSDPATASATIVMLTGDSDDAGRARAAPRAPTCS